MSEQTDLFGHPAGPIQGSLFGEGDNQFGAPVQTFLPDPADIRRRLNTLLEKARNAAAMPWSDRDARMWQTVFPQMAGWLPDDEANQLRLSFAREIERLNSAN
ncbi:MAG TPA: hypothetical protein VII73_10485 [Caulobacteraceae bacterium]